jgi:hypothetical protein
MGGRPGLGWGFAVLGAGLRWGTTGLSDLAVATRLVGSTVTSGTPAVRGAMIVALAAAILDEAQMDGLSASWPLRAASVTALVTLAVVFIVRSSLEISIDIAWWALAAGAVTVATLAIRPLAKRLPPWVPTVVAGMAVVFVGAVS